MNLSDKIEQVNLKARQLGLKVEHLQDRNAKLVGENRNLQHQLSNAINMIADLEEKLEVAANEVQKKEKNDPKDIKDIRKQIDASIDDIDHCITWLEKS